MLITRCSDDRTNAFDVARHIADDNVYLGQCNSELVGHCQFVSVTIARLTDQFLHGIPAWHCPVPPVNEPF